MRLKTSGAFILGAFVALSLSAIGDNRFGGQDGSAVNGTGSFGQGSVTVHHNLIPEERQALEDKIDELRAYVEENVVDYSSGSFRSVSSSGRNNTGKPMYIHSYTTSAGHGNAAMIINGTLVCTSASGASGGWTHNHSCSGLVPPGGRWSVGGEGSTRVTALVFQ